MSNLFNSIEFARHSYMRPSYLNKDKNEVDYDEMYDDIKTVLKVLIKNNYQIKIIDDGETVSMEYNFRDPDFGYRLEWLSENDYIETYGKEEARERDV